MAVRKVNVFLLVANLVMLLSSVVNAGKVEEVVQESSGGLPFLQFTNGGLRVNFAGYHAEAGLGGLLTGSRTGGGLHASAGTPSGAHAGAGLGGLLNGDNASTGGGLHAEAGLGNGRPEARAGLGGLLDANSFNPIAGGLYAEATRGDTVAANPVASSVEVQKSSEKPASGHTNIQIISRADGKKHKNERAIASKSFLLVNEAVPTEINIASAPVKPVVPVASAGLYGSLYAGATIDNKDQVQTVPASISKPILVETSVPTNSNVAANANAAVGADFNTFQELPVNNRWYFRKRFRNGPVRKQVIRTTSLISNPPDAASAASSAAATGEIISRLNPNDATTGEVTVVGTKTYKAGSLFDDIFNIPISTLTAVNQLLRNNVG